MTGKEDLTTLITNYLATLGGDYTARWKEMERLAGLGEGGAFAAPSNHAATHAAGGSDPITGALSLTGDINSTGNIIANGQAIATQFVFHAGGRIQAGPDGTMKLSNSLLNDFNLLQFGGTTAAFPALSRVGGNLNVVAADGSANRTMGAQSFTVYGGLVDFVAARILVGAGTPEGAQAAPVGSLFLRTDGPVCLYVKQTGAATNTGWVAK